MVFCIRIGPSADTDPDPTAYLNYVPAWDPGFAAQ
jgi:hypothetical protein